MQTMKDLTSISLFENIPIYHYNNTNYPIGYYNYYEDKILLTKPTEINHMDYIKSYISHLKKQLKIVDDSMNSFIYNKKFKSENNDNNRSNETNRSSSNETNCSNDEYSRIIDLDRS